jgi:hypothetical protein
MRLSILLSVIVLLGAGCTDAPTGVPMETATPGDSTAVPPPGTSITEFPPIPEWEAAEEARIAQERDSSVAVLDSLREEWNRLGGVITGANPLLLYCAPMQYEADVKVIGPSGGSITVGQHKIVIPKGALSEAVVITAEAPVSLVVSVRLSPHGLRFAKPLTLTMSYAHCNRPSLLSERVAYTDELFNVLEWPASQDRTKYERVDVVIDHFSRYAVAY